MRWLIDGYNVMHAGGRLGPKLSREGFRRARRRFLDELAAGARAVRRRRDDRGLRRLGAPGRLPARFESIEASRCSSRSETRMPTPGSKQIIAEHSNPKIADRRFFRQPHPAGGLATPLPIAHGREVLGAAR